MGVERVGRVHFELRVKRLEKVERVERVERVAIVEREEGGLGINVHCVFGQALSSVVLIRWYFRIAV